MYTWCGVKIVTYHAYTDSQHTLILNLGSSPWKPLNERENLWARIKSQKVATYLCKYRSRTSDNLWKVEERQNNTRVVVGGCGIKTRWISNSDKLHKKYKQTDATHRRGQPTLATSPTCAFGNPEDTYYLHFLVILMTLSSFFFRVPTQFIPNVATGRITRN